MTRVIEDVNNVERLLIDGTEQGTVALLSIVGALILMAGYSPTLTLVALAPAPLLAAGALWYTLTAHRRYRQQREASSAMNALLMDNLQGIRQIKAFGRQRHEDERFRSRAEDLREGTLVVMRAWAWYGPAMQFVGSLGIGLVLWVGGAQVIRGELQVGELIAFMLYAGMFFYEPIGRLHGLNQMLQAARAAAARVFDILDADSERPTTVVGVAAAEAESPPAPGWVNACAFGSATRSRWAIPRRSWTCSSGAPKRSWTASPWISGSTPPTCRTSSPRITTDSGRLLGGNA